MNNAQRRRVLITHVLKYTLLLMSALHLMFFLYNSFKLCSYFNIQVDFGEGIILGNAKRLAEFKTIYPDIKKEFILGVYPPIYQLLSAGMSMITGINLASGRIVSILSVIIIAIMIYKLSSIESKVLRFSFSVLFLSSPVIMTWGPLMRVDLLAALFTVSGLYSFTKLMGKFKFPVTAMMFALSTLTKQIMFSGIIAVMIFLLLKKKMEDSLRLLLYYLFMFGGVTAGLILLTGGQYINHVYLYHMGQKFEIARLVMYEWFFRTHLLIIVSAMVVAVLSVKERKMSPFLYYCFTSMLFSLLIGKIGAATNYFIEPVVALILLIAVSLKITKKCNVFIIGLISTMMIVQFAIYSHNISLAPDIEEYQIFSNKVALLRYLDKINGKVLCEDASAAVISGKGPAIDWFLLAQVFRNNFWNEQEFIERILQENFTFLVLSFNINATSPQGYERERFTHLLLEEFRENFIFKEKIGNYYVYIRRA